MRASVLVLFCSIVMLALSGCGGSDRPKLASVTGTVKFNGELLAGATITFMPESTRGGSAVTDSAGKYELIYIRDIKGAPIGRHKVFISKLVDEAESIPENFSNPDKTELTAEVTAGSNTIDFDLESQKSDLAGG